MVLTRVNSTKCIAHSSNLNWRSGYEDHVEKRSQYGVKPYIRYVTGGFTFLPFKTIYQTCNRRFHIVTMLNYDNHVSEPHNHIRDLICSGTNQSVLYYLREVIPYIALWI